MATDLVTPRRSTRAHHQPLASPSISSLLSKFKTGKKPQKDEDEDDKDMSCVAVLTGTGGTYEGEYNSVTSQHAEMNAISAYVKAGGNLANVTKIVISSPPCSACALMLAAFSLTNVVEAGETYKDFTSSWRLPDNLRSKALVRSADILGRIRLCYGCKIDDAGNDDRIFARFWDDIGKKLD